MIAATQIGAAVEHRSAVVHRLAAPVFPSIGVPPRAASHREGVPNMSETETPSQRIVAEASRVEEITDSRGRRLAVRRPNALDKLRLFKAVGAENAQNGPYLGMALLAACVTSIDGVPRPFPTNERQVETSVAEVGDEGLEVVGQLLKPSDEDGADGLLASAKN